MTLDYPYLHSSMDRFEVYGYCKIMLFLIYLHSSMDRFEEGWEISSNHP